VAAPQPVVATPTQPLKSVTLPPVAPSVEAKLRKCPVIERANARIALVIGNSKYAFANALPNPTNDAIAVGKALADLGFDVVQGVNLDKSAMMSKIKEFNRKLEEADGQPLALFFYAGHGMQVNGVNYLVPIDARLERPSDLDFDVIDVNFVLKEMAAQTSCANLVFLDACRNNPLVERYFRSFGPTRGGTPPGGLAPIVGRIRETLIEFSAEADSLAEDGQTGNSPFTEALLQNIHSPGLDFQTMMRNVRSAVADATKGRQWPTEYGGITKNIVLLPSPLPGPPTGGPR
jgi:uncharacterized caspase-like protein